MSKNLKIGLALSGGGARGFAHLGVLKKLEQEKISIFCISGTSMGAVIGGLYAAFGTVDSIINFFNFSKISSFFETKKFYQSIAKGGLLSLEKAEIIFKNKLHNVKIEDLKIPFTSVAVSLKTAQEVKFKKGDLASAIFASSALPFIFSPIRIDDDLFIDGGLFNVLPIDACFEMGADLVIGVDVSDDHFNNFNLDEKINIFKIPQLIFNLALNKFKNEKLEELNKNYQGKFFTLKPKVSILKGNEFDKLEEFMFLGEREYSKNRDEIHQFLKI